LNLKQMLFTLRSDASMHNIINSAMAPNGGTLAGSKSGKCYGVNNGVCDVNYTFNIGWGNPTALAPGKSITLTGFPNGNSQTQGGSTSDGLPLYLDVIHNVTLVDSAGNTYPATPYTIYPMLGGYFADWTNYSTPSGRMFPVESAGLNSFPVKNTNTMVYDLMYLNGGSQSNGVVSGTVAGDIALADNWADPTYVEEFSYMRAQHPWMDMTISFGGWGSGNNIVGYPSENLQLIFQSYYNNGGTVNQTVINNTAKNMINTALMFGFNGVDIDFEQGMCSHPGQVSWCSRGGTIVWNQASIAGYEALLKALYSYANSITTAVGSPLNGTKFNISTALPAGVDTMALYVNLGGNFATVLDNVTYGNLMTYDYHGQFDAGANYPLGVSDANAGLMRSAHTYGNVASQYYDIYDTLFCGTGTTTCPGVSGNYLGYFALMGTNVPSALADYAAKLNLGIPTYTRTENLQKSALLNTAIYQILNANQTWQPSVGGVASYRCIYNNGGTGSGGYCAPGKQDELPASVTINDIITAWKTASPAQTPWFYVVANGTPYFGTFDHGASAVNKISSLNSAVANITSGATLNGAFVWEIDEDIPVQDSQYATYGLMYNICTAFNSNNNCSATY
jgi:GH18 family chitinase